VLYLYLSRQERRGGEITTRPVLAILREFAEVKAELGTAQREILRRKQAEENLRASEDKYRAMVDGIPDVVMRFDREGRHLFVSGNVQNYIDLPAARFLGRTSRELGFPEDFCAVREKALRKVVETGKNLETEFSFQCKNGPGLFNWRLVPEFDARGGVRSIFSICRDITAHRRAEKNYQTLFREMLDGFALHEMVFDEKGEPSDYTFLVVNPAFERLTGLKAEDILGKRVRDVLPGTENFWIETYGRVVLTGEPVLFENYSKGLDKYFQVSAFRPAPGQFACIFADITERKRFEEALRSSEEQFRQFFEHLTVGVAVFEAKEEGRDFVFTDMNRAGQALSRVDIGEIRGRNLPDVFPGVRDQGLPEALYEVWRTGEPLHLPLSEYRDERSRQWVEHRVFRLPSGRVAVVFEDRSEQMRLEEGLRQAHKMESVGRLAGGVAHDFNNMLGVILGHVEMAMDSVGPDQALYGDLAEIRKAAERSADLTRQLLAFARKQTILPKVLSINETIAGMMRMLKRMIGEDIRLVWTPDDDLWPVEMDPTQVDQIIANLTINARDAISGGGTIFIETRNVRMESGGAQGLPLGDYVMLAVRDTGCGMDQETQSHLFEPFFTTKELGKGTGLGLATIYGIVTQNRGGVLVESEPGLGTNVLVFIPRAEGKTEEEVVEEEPEPLPGNETILLVEDEPAILKLAQAILSHYGYTVLAAETPEAALSLAEKNGESIHLLLTDVVMPGMNGKELRDRIAAFQPGIKVLFMSGYPTEVIAQYGVMGEGIQCLKKPFTVKTMAAKVREALAA
ncbi:MAG: PAS domain-containing protein, partial [Thermodesulfobacteriota bacterium]